MNISRKFIRRFKKVGGTTDITNSKYIMLDDENNIIFDENSPEHIKELEDILCTTDLDITSYFIVRSSLQLLLETKNKDMINKKNIETILLPVTKHIVSLKTLSLIVTELEKLIEEPVVKKTIEPISEYEEKQEGLLCGKHAVNFLLGCENIVNDPSNPDSEYIDKAYNLAYLCKNKDVILQKTDPNSNLYHILTLYGSTGDVECDIVEGNYSMNYMVAVLEILRQTNKIGSVGGPKYFINDTLNSNAIVNYINSYVGQNIRGFLIHSSGIRGPTNGHWVAIKMKSTACNNKPSLYDSVIAKQQCMGDINQQMSVIQSLIDKRYTQLVFFVINEVSSETTEMPSETTEMPSETTEMPSEVPSETTEMPSEVPSETTEMPSEVPSETTEMPSEVPSETTEMPSEVPSESTEMPSEVPSETTEMPSEVPSETTEMPSEVPSETTEMPSEVPSETTEMPTTIIPQTHGKFKFHIKMKIPYITIGNVKIDKDDINKYSTPIAYQTLLENKHYQFENIEKKYDSTNKNSLLENNDIIYQILYDPNVSYKPTFNIAISNYIKTVQDPMERELVGIAIKNALHNKVLDTQKIDTIIDEAIKTSSGGLIRRFKRIRH
jgi:hypothetical protein